MYRPFSIVSESCFYGVICASLPLPAYQLDSQWTSFREIGYWKLLFNNINFVSQFFLLLIYEAFRFPVNICVYAENSDRKVCGSKYKVSFIVI